MRNHRNKRAHSNALLRLSYVQKRVLSYCRFKVYLKQIYLFKGGKLLKPNELVLSRITSFCNPLFLYRPIVYRALVLDFMGVIESTNV